MVTFAERFGYTPKIEKAKPCWHVRLLSQPCLLIHEGERDVAIMTHDTSKLLLVIHLAKKEFHKEYTHKFAGKGPAPSVSEVVTRLHESSTGISLNAVHLLQELGMATKEKAAAKNDATKDAKGKGAKADAKGKDAKVKDPAPAPAPAPAPEPAKGKGKDKDAKAGKDAKATKEPKEKKGRASNIDLAAKYSPCVKEDDIRMQEGSARTVIFRAFAKAGKTGTTCEAVAKETKLDLAVVQANVRALAGGGSPRLSVVK